LPCFISFDGCVLPAAAAGEADFGLMGITGFESARLNAFCDGSVVLTPCDITFEFHDINGRTLKQVSTIVQPESTGFVDFTLGASLFVPGRVEIDPCFTILRGTAQASVEIFDNFTQRTRILIDWGDGSRARSAADVDFGAVAITRSDIARMGAFGEGDGSVMPACEGAYLGLRYFEAGSTATRVSIEPCWTVANGAAVLDVQTVDSFTGFTLTQGYPAALVSSTP
jgi:hypothetical protein